MSVQKESADPSSAAHHLFGYFGVGVDRLHIIVIVQGLEQPDDFPPHFGIHIHGVFGQTGHFSHGRAKIGFGQGIAHRLESGRVAADLEQVTQPLHIIGPGLQGQLQNPAGALLATGGRLTQGETMDAQQAARSAYSDRGMGRSNAGIGAEILGTDQAQRARMMQNAQFAQGVDASGQQQLNQNRGYAQGVQAQNQGLSQFNAGQQNQMSQFNAGQRTGISQFNTGQANQIGANLAQFNAGQNQQNSQFNATGMNAMNQDAASRADANARFNYQGQMQNQQFNASGINAMNQDAAARGDANARFNYQGQLQQNNDAWGRTRDQAINLGTQAINPNEVGLRLSQGAPDYANAMLGYGGDLANTNYNAAASRYNSGQNNSAALMGAGINTIGQMGNAFGSYYGRNPGGGSSNPGGAYGGGSSYG